MRIAEINMVTTGSTGKIMLDVAKLARARGHIVKTFSTHLFSIKYQKLPKAPEGHEYFGCYLDNALHYVLSSRLGKNGTHSKLTTLSLIRKLKKFNPDVVHLHNLHKFCINFSMLFKYLKKSGVKVFWTLHDCWAFTGHCPNFDMVKCTKWQSGCYNCSQLSNYPKEMRDTSRYMYEKKKEWFSSLDNLTFIAPSEWLNDKVKQSFLREYPVKTIKNGIDLSIFKPIDSDFRNAYELKNKKIVLAVADVWSERKGLDAVCEIAKNLGNDYALVVVGVNEETEKMLPESVIAIRHTNSQSELAEIYSSADVFINPTREEVLGLVNLEALACGTPVITYNTGGSPETIDEKSGIVVDKNDIDAMLNAIKYVCEDKPFKIEDCVSRAKEFDKDKKFLEYVKLYESWVKDIE